MKIKETGFPLLKVEYDSSGNPIYIGENANLIASDDSQDWRLRKVTWAGSNPEKVERNVGSWTNRVAVFS